MPVMFHLHVKNISRGNGRSVVAAAAYRAGDVLPNDAEEKASAFGGRRDVLFTQIVLPSGAPSWMSDRAKLWNAVEAAEKRKDARLAKEIEFAIPRQLPRKQWLAVAQEMAAVFVANGHVVDFAIHEDGTGHNPHVHLLMTTRAVGADGFGNKLREADGKAFVSGARTAWERIANAALAKAGVATSIDSRSLAAQGIDRTPTVHRGVNRAERLARRKLRGSMPMIDHDFLEARQELLAQPGVRERFPLLSGRPDWPPESREPPAGLSPVEQREFRAFWNEVTDRALGEQAWETEVPERRTSDVAGDLFEKIRDAELKTGAERREAFVTAIPAYREMFERIEREIRSPEMARAGDPEAWSKIARAIEDPQFDQLLAEARALEAKRNEPGHMPRATKEQIAAANRLETDPVPDPEGNLISPAELYAAQERMLRETEGPVRNYPRPRPAHIHETLLREAAQDAVDQINDIHVPDEDVYAYRIAPHENRLDWLGVADQVTERREHLAQERMLAEMEAPERAVPQTPRPETLPFDERRKAEQEVLRSGNRLVSDRVFGQNTFKGRPQENRDDWPIREQDR